MDANLKIRQDIARQIDQLLGPLPEVTAVYVFGSVASGHVDERSDVDITFVCSPEILPTSKRKDVLSRTGSNWTFDDDPGANPIWDSWDRGWVDGVLVDSHYQTASAVSEVLDEVINDGAITTARVPSRPYTMAGMLQRSWPIRDKEGIFASWLEQTRVYPRRLKRNILRHHVPALRDSVDELTSSAERRIGPGVFLFFLSHGVNALQSILFALNDTFDPADRWQEQTVLPTLTNVPEDFPARYSYVLEGPFDDDGAIERARAFDELAGEILRMAEAEMR